MEDLSVLQPKVRLTQLQASFGSHAIVIQGDLPQKYFPRCYRHHPGKRICTCGTVTQRAKRPHVYYVGALEGELDLDNLPTRRKPGRKRAAAGTSQESRRQRQASEDRRSIASNPLKKVTGKMRTCVLYASARKAELDYKKIFLPEKNRVAKELLQAPVKRTTPSIRRPTFDCGKSIETCKDIFSRKACVPVSRID